MQQVNGEQNNWNDDRGYTINVAWIMGIVFVDIMDEQNMPSDDRSLVEVKSRTMQWSHGDALFDLKMN